MTAEDVHYRWMSELSAEPDASSGRSAAGKHLVRHLLAKTTIPVLHPDPGRTWIWSDLHLDDRPIIKAWRRPFRNTGEDRTRTRPRDRGRHSGEPAPPGGRTRPGGPRPRRTGAPRRDERC